MAPLILVITFLLDSGDGRGEESWIFSSCTFHREILKKAGQREGYLTLMEELPLMI